MGRVIIAATLTILLVFAKAEAASPDLYDNVVPADTADCLKKVRKARRRSRVFRSFTIPKVSFAYVHYR